MNDTNTPQPIKLPWIDRSSNYIREHSFFIVLAFIVIITLICGYSCQMNKKINDKSTELWQAVALVDEKADNIADDLNTTKLDNIKNVNTLDAKITQTENTLLKNDVAQMNSIELLKKENATLQADFDKINKKSSKSFLSEMGEILTVLPCENKEPKEVKTETPNTPQNKPLEKVDNTKQLDPTRSPKQHGFWWKTVRPWTWFTTQKPKLQSPLVVQEPNVNPTPVK